MNFGHHQTHTGFPHFLNEWNVDFAFSPRIPAFFHFNFPSNQFWAFLGWVQIWNHNFWKWGENGHFWFLNLKSLFSQFMLFMFLHEFWHQKWDFRLWRIRPTFSQIYEFWWNLNFGGRFWTQKSQKCWIWWFKGLDQKKVVSCQLSKYSHFGTKNVDFGSFYFQFFKSIRPHFDLLI